VIDSVRKLARKLFVSDRDPKPSEVIVARSKTFRGVYHHADEEGSPVCGVGFTDGYRYMKLRRAKGKDLDLCKNCRKRGDQ